MDKIKFKETGLILVEQVAQRKVVKLRTLLENSNFDHIKQVRGIL